MKKNNFSKRIKALALAGSAALLIAGVVVVNGCKKENTNAQVKQTVVDDESEAITAHILAFKERMAYYHENPNLKTGGQLYTADSAVLELKSLLNFNFCYANIITDKKKLSTDEIIMPLDELSKINDPDLMQLYYDEIIEIIRSQMLALDYENKKLLMVDLEQTGTDSNGDAIVSVTSIVGNQVSAPLHDDSWWYGLEYGICNGNDSGADAATVLDQRVTEDLIPVPPIGCRWYFVPTNNTGYLDPTSYPNPTPGDVIDNYEDYQIYYAIDIPGNPDMTIGYEEQCVSGGEMDFYETQYKALATNYANSLNKKFYQCDLFGLPDTEYGMAVVKHFYKIYVGNRYQDCSYTLPKDILY